MRCYVSVAVFLQRTLSSLVLTCAVGTLALAGAPDGGSDKELDGRARRGRPGEGQAVRRGGADVNTRANGGRRWNGWSALMLAASEGDEDLRGFSSQKVPALMRPQMKFAIVSWDST